MKGGDELVTYEGLAALVKAYNRKHGTSWGLIEYRVGGKMRTAVVVIEGGKLCELRKGTREEVNRWLKMENERRADI